MKSGIYKITNSINNKFYIGSSKNIERRFYIHKSKLKNNDHANIILQRSYNKYGDVFKYEIIEENIKTEDLLIVEQKYLDKYIDNDLPIATIRWRLNSNNKKFTNYNYKN